LILCVGVGAIPQDAEWEGFIHALRVKFYSKFLYYAPGHVEVTSVQRKETFEILTRRGIHCAVVTESGLVRGIVTAASWFGVKVKAFSVANTNEAFAALGIDGARAEETHAELQKLIQRVESHAE